MRSVSVSLCLGESHGFVKGGEPTSATLERMRAFAGVYYEVTMVLTTSKKRDALWVKPGANSLSSKAARIQVASKCVVKRQREMNADVKDETV